MEISKTNVKDLLSNHDVIFYIPPYQRNYEWDREQCEILFEDIKKISSSNSSANSLTEEHFFGTIIYYADVAQTDLEQPKKYILVDGQQRLTSVMLLLAACRDASKDQEHKKVIEKKYLKNDSVEGDVELKIKLKQVESDWDAYKNIVLSKDMSDENKKSRVYKNYKFFYDLINHLSEAESESEAKVWSLISHGLGNLSIVTIQLEPEKNTWEKPQEIFESMNSLGKPLSLADFVRNYLLLGKTAKEQEELYHDKWITIEKNLISSDSKNFNTSSYIRDFMQLRKSRNYKKAEEANYKELYREFKNIYGNNGNHKELFDELSKLSKFYAYIGILKNTPDEISQKLKDLKQVEFSVFYSFILGLFEWWDQKKFNDKDIADILDAIFIYIARRRIMRLAEGENKMILFLYSHYSALIDSVNKKAKMFEILSRQSYPVRLPNDEEIRAKLMSDSHSFHKAKSAKFFLALLEESLTKNRPDLRDSSLQVEHIMPQKLSKKWQESLGKEGQRIYDSYLNNIGNLTLIRHNKEASNKSFDEKKKIYSNNSGMQITRDKIVDQKKWGEKEIKNRAEYLIDILLNKILNIPHNLKKSNNWSQGPSSKKIDFERMGLIGKEIYLIENPEYVAKVTGIKDLIYKGETCNLSPLTGKILTELGKANNSKKYWGVRQWAYKGKSLKELLDEFDD
jgi:uncharacterized protein with ParB-like and HNH nuclease domain